MHQYSIKLDEDRLPMLVREKALPGRRNRLRTPAAITEYMNNVFSLEDQAEEYVYMICLDSACNVNAIMNVSHGTFNCALISPREILIRALLSGAASMVLVHNHPSGSLDPSDADIKATDKIKRAGELVGIGLVDHVIVGMDGEYYSFYENGDL